MATIERAIEIAAKAHEGQFDKAGSPYIFHPLRVMLSLSGEEERIVAVLHDVVEDSDLTLEDLKSQGFSSSIIEAVESLTKRPGENYEDFVRRAACNSIGREVKLADLSDNFDLSRIEKPNEKDYERVKKYQRAINIIQGCKIADVNSQGVKDSNEE